MMASPKLMQRRPFFRNTHDSSLITHDSSLITHDSSLITYDSSLIIECAALILCVICGLAFGGQRRPNAEALKKYAGRYQLEVGLIPISTLDVSLENDTLWVKPSLLKKRKLLFKAKTVFVDEVDGKRYTFAKNDEGAVVSVTFEYEGADYTAQKVVLPAPSLKGNTVFRLKGYPDATIVVLTGSFNNWDQSQFVFAREGDEWICRIDLEPGKYTYKFVVDGNWLLDPYNSNTEEDAAGNVNSVLLK